MTDADPYRSEPKQYYLITYSMELPGGRSTPSYFNAVIEGSPMEWFVREVEAALRPMPPYPPGSGVPRSLIYAPPPRPPVLLSAWPITETQFEKLRPVFWRYEVRDG